MNLQLTSDAPSLGRDERFIQGGGGMGVEVVQNQHDLLGLRVVAVDQLLYAIMRPESSFVRRSVTLMWRQPARGSVTMKRLAVPSRSYS